MASATPEREPVPADGDTRVSRLAWLRRFVPFVFLLAAVWIAWHELARIDFHALRASVQALPTGDLLALLALGLVAMLAMTLYDWRAARALGVSLPPAKLLRYAWVANSFNNLVGLSGLAGSGIRFLLLTREGVDTRRAAGYAGIVMFSIPMGLSLLSWPLLLSDLPANSGIPVPAPVAYTVLAVFAVLLPVYVGILRQRRLSRRLMPDVPPLGWRPIAELTAVSLLDWLLAASLCWLCIRALGAPVPADEFLLAYAFAVALGLLSLLPGGLGVFDTTLLLMLSGRYGAAEPILAGLLLYRVTYYAIPWLIGVYLGAGLLMPGESERPPALLRHWREHPAFAVLRIPLNLLAALGVRVLAYLTFGAGLVLLASAAFPALEDRLALLQPYVPLVAMETSHLLSVGAGVLLVALSRGIAEQVRSAYRLSMILLVTGAVLSLLKGLDFEEALAMLLVAGALRLQRDRFYRLGYPLASPRTFLWGGALVLVLIAYSALGDWVHGQVPLGWSALSRFAPHLDAPRFARSLLFAVLVALLYLAWALFRSKRPALRPPDAQMLAKVEDVLKAYGGSSFAHLAFLGDKYLFWTRSEHAFIQYGRVRDRLVALGDPCGDPAEFDEAITAFRRHADRYDFVPVFYEVSERHLHAYHDAGFALFKLGEAAVVDVDDFTLAGKRGEALRHGVNRAKREGLSFAMLEHPVDAQTWTRLQAISQAWLSERGAAEKGFSLGYYDEAYLERSPLAVIRHGDRLVAFANLMPDYHGHEELSIDLMRHLPDAPTGTMDLLFAELIAYAKSRGYRHFNLGMAPLAGVGETPYARSGERLARLAYEYGNRFYNYKGLRGFKEKFHPRWQSHYLAYPTLAPLPALIMDTAALVAGGYRRIFFKTD